MVTIPDQLGKQGEQERGGEEGEGEGEWEGRTGEGEEEEEGGGEGRGRGRGGKRGKLRQGILGGGISVSPATLTSSVLIDC